MTLNSIFSKSIGRLPVLNILFENQMATRICRLFEFGPEYKILAHTALKPSLANWLFP
jgi:hypothetical protein